MAMATMKRVLLAAAALAAFSASAQAQKPKDMLWGLAGDWCSVDQSTRKRFTITDRGQLIDGQIGEAPICTMKSATNRNQAVCLCANGAVGASYSRFATKGLKIENV